MATANGKSISPSVSAAPIEGHMAIGLSTFKIGPRLLHQTVALASVAFVGKNMRMKRFCFGAKT